jgi:hypothetical protein
MGDEWFVWEQRIQLHDPDTMEATQRQEFSANGPKTSLKHRCIPRVRFVYSGNMPCDRALLPVLSAASPAICIAALSRAGLGLLA